MALMTLQEMGAHCNRAMRYLVTGCAGFIASRVCEMLLEDGHEVVGMDSLNDAYDVRLKHWRLGSLLGVDVIRQNDIRQPDHHSRTHQWPGLYLHRSSSECCGNFVGINRFQFGYSGDSAKCTDQCRCNSYGWRCQCELHSSGK